MYRNTNSTDLDDNELTLSAILHEIKNPVTLISSSLQLIESDHPEVSTFQFWGQTMEDIKNLRQLLEDLSTCQNGKQLKCTDFSLKEFIAETIGSVQAYYSEASVKLNIEYSGSPETFHGDRKKLRIALVNLLKNALEASKPGSLVQMRVIEETSHLHIYIEDQGCGISSDSLLEIFCPFQTTKPHGTGLGLCIVKEIVDSHNGRIEVQSEVGKGTVFHLILSNHF